MELSASAIDFGVVVFGSTNMETITVTSVGTGDLIISAITDLLAPFTITGGTCLPPPITLLPGASCTIDVEIAPAGISGAITGSFDIISNAASSPDTVSLIAMVPAVEVPTLSRSGLLLLALLLAALGWVAVGRRQPH